MDMRDRDGLFSSTVLVTIAGLLEVSGRGTGTVCEEITVLLLIRGSTEVAGRGDSVVSLLR